MIIKAKGLTWAKVTGGGNGSAMVYGTGKYDRDRVVRVDQSEERSDSGFYADDHKIDSDNSVNAASIAFEMAKVDDDFKVDALGYEKDTNELRRTTDESPYIGIGFIYGYRHCGKNTYKAFWYHKVQFSLGSRSFNTKGENLEFQTESIEGEAMAVQLTDGGKESFFAESLELDTESAARAWLDGKAGITSGS